MYEVPTQLHKYYARDAKLLKFHVPLIVHHRLERDSLVQSVGQSFLFVSFLTILPAVAGGLHSIQIESF